MSGRFDFRFLGIDWRMEKRQYNDAGFMATSGFGLTVCTNSFKVPVLASDETEARLAAEGLCNNFTKPPSKPNTVIVTLVGDGPPFKRGKPVTVRARVMGEGDLSTTVVQATFSNGDRAMLLRPTGGNFFEGTWIPTTVPRNAQVTNIQRDQQDVVTSFDIEFPVTVTVNAHGCDQSASATADTTVKMSNIHIEIARPDPEVGFIVPWKPGSQVDVQVIGRVLDGEGAPVPSEVVAQFWLDEKGEGQPKFETKSVKTTNLGGFGFLYSTKSWGQLTIQLFVQPEGIPIDISKRALKVLKGVIRPEIAVKISDQFLKEAGLKFYRAQKDSAFVDTQPVEVGRGILDLKEVNVLVLALTQEGDGWEWKPVKGAVVELVDVGSRKTGGDGATKFTFSSEGTTVNLIFELVPDFEVKVASLPKGYLSRPNAEGKLFVFIGKDFDVMTDPETGRPKAVPKSPNSVIAKNRRFKVTVSDGTTEGNIAKPEGDLSVHTITYYPPKAINEPVREVTVRVEDAEISIYKSEFKLRVFRDAFLTFNKLGFQEIDPIPIDLVELNGVKVVPGIIRGQVQENPLPPAGRPINGVKVQAIAGETEKTDYTKGTPGPEAGRFDLRDVADNQAELNLQKPVVMPFLDYVEEFAHTFDPLRELGYRTPRFREQDGFLDENDQPLFRYRWDLRFETDEQKLQRILDAIKRADAALKFTAEVDPMMKQYLQESISAIVDLVLFCFSEFKLFGKLAEMVSVGKGIGKGVKLSTHARQGLRARLKKEIPELTEDELNLVERLVDEAISSHRGLTDSAIEQVQKATGSVLIARTLKGYRDDLAESTELLVAGLKADIVGFLKSMLNKFKIIETPDLPPLAINRPEWWIDKAIDSVANALVSQIMEMGDISVESLFGLGNKITEATANALMYPARSFHQTVVDVGFKKLGRYEISGSTEQAIKRIETMKKGLDLWRGVYESARAPFSSAIGAIKSGLQKLHESTAVMTGPSYNPAVGVLEDAANLTGSILDGILPIGSAFTVMLGGTANTMLGVSVPLAWISAVGWSPSDLPPELNSPFFPLPRDIYAPFFPFPIENSPLLAYVNAGGSTRFTPVRSRSRQLNEYEAVVNQIKSALQNNNYEQVLQLSRNLSEATTAVSDAIEAKLAIVTKAIFDAYNRDQTFPARARQATDIAEASNFYRREFSLRVGSYLIGESDEAVNKAIQSADVALQKTQEAMGLLDGAIEHLRSLGVTLPHLLRFTSQVQQVSLTEWRITFTAQNIGGQPSPVTDVKFVATNGIAVSPNSWNLPSLSPNATQSITVTARTPQRFTSGFGVIRTTLGTQPEDFNASVVPAIIFLTSKDEIPPIISNLTPKEDETIRTANPLIAANIVDSLSGLDVSSLKMTLDGQQVGAAYDIATRRFSFRPTQPLSEGTHTVTVEATDLDGNTARKEWKFTVRSGAPVEITDLRISPNPFSPNGDGIDDVLNIHFKLSGDAVLNITVTDSQNQVVKTLATEQPFPQGEHDLTWDGVKDDGQRAESGSYGVRIAIVREGRQQQVVEAQVTADTSPLSITGVSVSPETMRLTKDTATVNFNLSQNARIEVKVYMGENTDDDGYVIRSLVMENAQKGSNSVTWDGRADDGRFVPPGVYSVAVEADAGTNTNRVPLAGRITVRSLPDLMAVSLISADQDGKTVLTATVRNIGAEAAQNIVVRFFVKDIVLGDKVITNLDAGAEATVEFTIDPTRQVLVTENLAFVVDPENAIDELEEFNNRLETRLQIQAVRLAHVLPAGISLVSIPIQLLDPSPQTAFGFSSPEETKIAWWDPQKEGDIKYRFANEISALEPGKGYFVKLPDERILQWTGVPTRTQDNNLFVINLQRGWNLIGLPRPGSVPLSDVNVKRASDQNPIAFTSPNNRITEPYAWTYSNTERRYQLVYPEIGEFGTFDALKGYWVYAHEPCQLLIPAQSRSVYVARKRSQIEGWFFRVEAVAGDFTDSIVVGKNSTRLQAQKPPVSPEGQPVRLSIVDEQGRSWGASISDDKGRMIWKLLLEAGRSVEKVTLRFPDLGYLPKDLGVYLIDEGTGQKRYLRTTASVTFNFTPSRGETERKVLQLAIVPGATGLLRIVGLKAEPMRGRGVAIQFALTKHAQTQVEVLTLTGRKVATVESGQNRSAGRHQVIWQGRNGNGQPLPSSAYIVRVSATDEEGRQVQATAVLRLR